MTIGCLTFGVGPGHGLKDIAGQKFGRLTAVRPLGHARSGWLIWEAVCECGARCTAAGVSMRNGSKRSCGCLLADSKVVHGGARKRTSNETPEYRSWAHAKDRCYRRSHHAWHRYGGRGISMCERWRTDFSTFLADMGQRPVGTSLDRWPNPDGNYETGNCRWATRNEQASNRSKGAQ